MRERFLPFGVPSIGEEEIAEVVETLRSGWITTGPKVARFADMFASMVDAKFAAPVSSATAGLHLALLAHGIGPGDEVVTTPMTFVATLNVILHVGATPVLADIDRGNFLVSPESFERAVTKRTRALLPVHFAGQPVELDPIIELAKAHDLAVIEDAAHALGAGYGGRPIGSFPTTSVFSFHPCKNITTGEGGMVVTADAALHERVSLLRFHGMDKDAWRRYAKEGSPRYDIRFPGFKYNMMDIQAAIGLHQLPKLKEFNARREELAHRYQQALSGLEGLFLPQAVPYETRHAWHIYTPLVDIDRLRIDRDTFMAELKARNIGSGLHYQAVHEFSPFAKRFGWRPEGFPEAHFVSERILSLPLFPAMTDSDQDDVIEAVQEICAEFRA